MAAKKGSGTKPKQEAAKKTEPKTPPPAETPEESKPTEEGDSPKETTKKKKDTTATKKSTATKTTVKPAPRITALTKASAMVEKLFGKDSPLVPLDEDNRTESHPFVPTGSVILDYLIGGRPNSLGILPCPGVPRARMTEVYGTEGSGKTTFALNVVREVLLKNPVGTACFVDFEHAISRDFCKEMGIPVNEGNRFQLHQPKTLEEGMQLMLVMASAGVDVVVLDSVGAVVPIANYEKSIEKQAENPTGQIGLIARLWSSFIPRFQGLIAQTGTALIAIAQMRQRIKGAGDYGPASAPQGGDVWKYYSSLRLRLTKGTLIQAEQYDPIENKNMKVSVGLEVTAKIDKSKVSGSVGSFKKFYLRFGDGIDDARSVIEIAAAHKIVQKKGAWYFWQRKKGDMLKGQGAENFHQAVRETPGALDELIAQVKPILHSKEIPKPRDAPDTDQTTDLFFEDGDEDDIKT